MTSTPFEVILPDELHQRIWLKPELQELLEIWPTLYGLDKEAFRAFFMRLAMSWPSSSKTMTEQQKYELIELAMVELRRKIDGFRKINKLLSE